MDLLKHRWGPPPEFLIHCLSHSVPGGADHTLRTTAVEERRISRGSKAGLSLKKTL